MAKIEDVLKIESERSHSTTWNEIHLFKVGEFYRAYEFSAWLTAVVSFNDHVRQQTKDRQPLKATRTVIAHTDDTFCFVGFPVKSINKFIPQREDFIAVDDKHLLIKIPQGLFADVLQEVNYDSLVFAFNDWKNNLPVKEKKKKEKNTPATSIATPPQTTTSPTGLLSQLMAYDPDTHTADENINFINGLKHQISAIL